MKRILTVLVCALMVLSITACTKKEMTKEYTDGKIVLVLPDDFSEYTEEDFDYCLERNDCLIMCSHSSQQYLDENNLYDVELDEFTSFFTEGEELVLSEKMEGYNLFAYKATGTSGEMYYLVGVYDTNDGYWLVNFICMTEDLSKYESLFKEWAGKVTFK